MSSGAGDITTDPETRPPPKKKAKTDPGEVGDSTEMTDPEGEKPEGRILKRGTREDPDYVRQRDLFFEQFEQSGGYDVDWDNFDYVFSAFNLESAGGLSENLSDKELMEELIQTAIDAEKVDTDVDYKYVKYVSANVQGCQGLLYFITFWAQDLSSPNQHPKLYQTKLRTFADETFVYDFRLRPTQELHYSHQIRASSL